jgi:hypothetical protein
MKVRRFFREPPPGNLRKKKEIAREGGLGGKILTNPL